MSHDDLKEYQKFGAPSVNDRVDDNCLVAPWLVLLTKEPKYSFMELWLFVMFWGFSAGPLLVSAFMEARQSTWMGLAFAEYLAFHVHCAVFLSVIDTLHWRRGNTSENSLERYACICFSQALIVYIVHCATPLFGR